MQSDIGPFGIVPRWVRLECKGQPWPLALYALLADKADRSEGGDGGWTIGRETLADELGTSASTVDRAVKHLEAIGALEVTHNKKGKEWSWSRYLVRAVRQVSSPVGQVSSRVVQVSSPVATFPITPNQQPPSCESPASPPVRERKPNPIWDALSFHFGEPTTASEKSHRGKNCKELAEVLATPEQIAERVAEHKRRNNRWTLSAQALVQHWTELSPRSVRQGSVDQQVVDQCVDEALAAMGNTYTADAELRFRLESAMRRQLRDGKTPAWVKQNIVFVASTVGIVL